MDTKMNKTRYNLNINDNRYVKFKLKIYRNFTFKVPLYF